MNNLFDIEDLIAAQEHEHILYMNIDSTSDNKYILRCESCGVKVFLGYWSLKTGHRYCIENQLIHLCPDSILDTTYYVSKNVPIFGAL